MSKSKGLLMQREGLFCICTSVVALILLTILCHTTASAALSEGMSITSTEILQKLDKEGKLWVTEEFSVILTTPITVSIYRNIPLRFKDPVTGRYRWWVVRLPALSPGQKLILCHQSNQMAALCLYLLPTPFLAIHKSHNPCDIKAKPLGCLHGLKG